MNTANYIMKRKKNYNSTFKFFLLPFFIISLSYNLNAQIFKAGDIFSGYVDLNPDTLINFNYSSNEVYNFDINNDLVNDYIIKAYSLNFLGGGTNYISIEPTNSNSFVSFGRKDSIYHNYYHYWMYSEMALPLAIGDSINARSANWQSKILYLTNSSGSAGTYSNPTDWIGSNDHYIGLKYQTVTDTLYSWIRVNCPAANKCYIKDYSSTGFINSINKISPYKQTIVAFPNPSLNIINFRNTNHEFDNSEIEIINIYGEVIFKQPYSNSINISSISAGLYTLKIYTSKNEIYYSSFLKN